MLKLHRSKASMKKRNKKGQSTVEYILLAAAVIAAVITFSSTFGDKLEDTYNQVTDDMTNMANRLSGSR